MNTSLTLTERYKRRHIASHLQRADSEQIGNSRNVVSRTNVKTASFTEINRHV